MIGIVGLICGITVLIIGAYKGLAALPLTILAGFVIVLTNQLEIWPAFSDTYLSGYVGFFKNYFLIFTSASLYATIMENSGAAVSIGYKFIDWFGSKRAVLVVFFATCALTYGGISLFVVVFAIAPIIMVLFKAADVPRRLAMGPLIAGSATLTMTSLPGTPQLTNVVPTKFLGTTLTSAPLLTLIGAVIMLILHCMYLTWEERRLRAAGEHFTFPEGKDLSAYEVSRNELPSAVISFIPMIIVIGMIVGLKSFITDSALLIVMSMLVASACALAFNWNRLTNKKSIINSGATGAITAISGPCAVVAFGSLVQTSPAFKTIVDWLLSFDMNIYVIVAVATSIISGITGSSSGGLQITMETLSDQYIASSADLEIIHRLSAIFAGTLDTLPHSSALFLMLSWLGLTHKEAYRFVGLSSIVIPALTGCILLAGVILLGL